MQIKVDPVALESFCRKAFVATGLPVGGASTAAAILVRTELRGVTSHGVWRLPTYIMQLSRGGAQPGASPTVTEDRAATAIVDAHDGSGLVAADYATKLAMEKARNCGVATVLVKNSNHFGAAGHYALICAEGGLIGLVFSNSPVIMKVTGSRGAVIGNGPTAYGTPAYGKAPVIFDAAMSVVAGGRIRLAVGRKEEVPDGWIVDSEGLNTRRPEAFTEEGGALVPLGDHKGYGLTLLGELLSGALSGAAMAGAIVNWTKDPAVPSNTGHAMVVIDPGAFGQGEAFTRRVSHLIDEIQAAPRMANADRIYYPGLLEHERELHALAHGLALDDVVWDALGKTASSLSLSADLQACVIARP
jgi:LDH2 family malate/lactate/ureidoglycolate dehydrogenase